MVLAPTPLQTGPHPPHPLLLPRIGIPDEPRRRSSQHLRQDQELGHLEPAQAPLGVADPPLTPADRVGDLRLGESSVQALFLRMSSDPRTVVVSRGYATLRSHDFC